jgi:hypothetical protein
MAQRHIALTGATIAAILLLLVTLATLSVESTNAEATMAKAPLVVAAQNVDVLAETIVP